MAIYNTDPSTYTIAGPGFGITAAASRSRIAGSG